jgi:mannose-6-phosphate isomerase-like protein (cupin superfamily)
MWMLTGFTDEISSDVDEQHGGPKPRDRRAGVSMPVFTSGAVPPAWCEMTFFEVVTLPPGTQHRFARRAPREKLIVCQGRCRIAIDGTESDAAAGSNLDLPDGADGFAVSEVSEDVVAVRMCGHWGDETGGSGLFTVDNSAAPSDKGDPVPYQKTTNFDSHYHDCDEYWVIWSGRGIAVSEGRQYEAGAGDCVATGMGHHHDFPRVEEPVRAVYFETTLQGAKRRGHLWEHTHGPAHPMTDRI